MGNGTPLKDFHVKHCKGKGEDGFIIVQNWVYYIDGACRENHLYGQLKDPPKDPLERAKMIHRFYEMKLEPAVREFTTFKRSLIAASKANALNPYPQTPLESQVDKLKGLQKTAKKFQLGEERSRAKMESYNQPNVELEDDEYEEEDETLEDISNIEI